MKKKKIFINITNHTLTEEQRVDAIKRYGITEFLELPSELKARYGQVPAGEDEEVLWDLAEDIRDWVNASHPEAHKWAKCLPPYKDVGDDKCPLVVLLQGELGVVGRLLRLLGEQGIPCVYATTRRESVETVQQDGSVVKTNVFKHAGFRNILPNTF